MTVHRQGCSGTSFTKHNPHQKQSTKYGLIIAWVPRPIVDVTSKYEIVIAWQNAIVLIE